MPAAHQFLSGGEDDFRQIRLVKPAHRLGIIIRVGVTADYLRGIGDDNIRRAAIAFIMGIIYISFSITI
ncbi:MAG: hypothetical protein H6672_02745 [Anaerolineaceae bacterium]|nr:hypothetical protein [Anaerolineaceae bacterium]